MSEARPRFGATHHQLHFPGGGVTKNPPVSAGDTGPTPGLGKSPGEGNGTPLQWKTLGYSPWGHKDLDTTEHALTYTYTHTHTHTHTHHNST